MILVDILNSDTCTAHDECRECPEMGEACAAATRKSTAYAPYVRTDNVSRVLSGEIIATEVVTIMVDGPEQEGPIGRYGETPYGPKVEAKRTVTTTAYAIGTTVAMRTETHVPHWDSGRPDWHTYHATVQLDSGSFTEVEYSGTCTVDPTPEVAAAYALHLAGIEAKRQADRIAEREAAQLREAATPARGKRAVVARGRKVPRGTTGEIIWFGTGAYGDRVGLKDAAGVVHWTAASNVDVIVGETPVPASNIRVGPAPRYRNGYQRQAYR